MRKNNLYIMVSIVDIHSLQLSGLEVLVFSLIKGFSKAGNALFMSARSMAEALGCSQKQILRVLRHLRERGIIQSDGSSRFRTNDYILPDKSSPDGQKVHRMDISSSAEGQNVPVNEDIMSDNYHKPEKKEKEGNNNPPLPHFENQEVDAVWQTLLTLKAWRKKEAASIWASFNKLKRYPPELAVMMINKAIEGGFCIIDKPSKEMLLASAPHCSAFAPSYSKSPVNETIDNDMIYHVILRLLPKTLWAMATAQPAVSSEKAALFSRADMTSRTITVYAPGEVKTWLRENEPQVSEAIRNIYPSFTIIL